MTKSIRSRNRRHFLALAASGVVGGLVLRLDREAQGAVTSAPRFILYNHANGLQKLQLERSALRSARDFDLAGCMLPFAPHKAELTVVQNLYCTPGEYLHGNGSSALSCTSRGVVMGAEGLSDSIVGGTTIDQLVAGHLSQTERLRSVVLGHPFNVNPGNCTQGTIIGRGASEPVYPTLDPVKAHELIFGVGGQDEVLLKLRKSYLDFLKDDIQTFQTELPGPERQKLEQYLESVREIERALAGGGAGVCPNLTQHPFSELDREGTNNPAFWRYMCDLGVAALQCGATRQVTMLHTYGCVHLMYEFDGSKRDHHDGVGHGDEEGPFMEKILAFHAESVAYMFQKLKAIPEGEGTMADTALVAWMSDGGGYHHGGIGTHPMVYLGRGNGRLLAGQWLRLEEKQHSLASAHLTAARALGLDLASFGDGTDPGSAPIPGLLA